MRNVFVDWLLQCDDFRECYLKKHFWIGQYPEKDLPALFSWDDLNHCLTNNRITNDRLRLSTAQEYEHFNKRVFRATKDSFGRATDHLLIHELQAVMRSGVTAVLESVNELTRPVSEMTERIASELDVRSAANAYVSFGMTSGFGIHNDDHDVIVVQLDGRKRWQFFSSRNDGEKATVEDLDTPSESDCGEGVIIESGDIMYIPKGTWHDVTAMNEKSLHLTISLVNPTLLDFMQWTLKKKSQQLSRQDIHRNSSLSEHRLAFFRNAFEGLFTEKNLDIFIKAYYASHAVSPIKATFPTLHSADVEDAFRRIYADVVVSEESDDTESISVFVSGRVHRLTYDEYALLLALPCGSERTGSSLLSEGRQWADLAPSLTRLMDKGLVGKKTKDRVAATIA